MKTRDSLINFVVTVILVTTEVSGFQIPSNSCYLALHKYLADVTPVFNKTDKSLALDIGELTPAFVTCMTRHTKFGINFSIPDSGRFAPECGATELVVELWRVISNPNIDRPNNFGTTEYFFKDQHCENPNPDLLAKHGHSKKVGPTGRVLVFEHVVEQEYMVRLCPCLPSHCSCESQAPGSQICSRILRVNNTGEDGVFPWCRGLTQSPHPKIDSPIVQKCPAQLKITGVIPSCTAVRHYDQVEVILQAVQGHPTNCMDRPLSEIIKSDGLESVVRLHALNETHGSFDVDIKNVTHNVYYCVSVELGELSLIISKRALLFFILMPELIIQYCSEPSLLQLRLRHLY